MGMMFGPLGTAIGATVGGLYGLVDGLGKAEEAAIAKAKAEMDQSKNMGSSLVSVFREFPEVQKNLKDFRAQYNKIESLRNKEVSKTKTVNVPAVYGLGYSKSATTETIKDPEAQAKAKGYKNVMASMVDVQFSKALKELPKDYQFSAAGSDPKGEAFTGTGEQYAKELEKVSNPGRKTAMYESFIKAQLAEEAKINKAKKEELKTIIIRLNHQKAMLVSQRESAMTQLRIKEKYSASADLLGFQEKIMGNLMTDQQKAQNRFNKALNSASEKLESSQEAAELKLKQGLMTLIKSSDTLQSAVRADLAVKRGASPFEAKTMDVTKPYAEKSSSEILEVIHTLKLDGKDRLAVEALVFEKKSSDEVAKSNKTFNDTSAKSALQRDSYFAREAAVKKNLERSNRMSSEGIRSSQKIRGFADQVAAARRLNAVGPGYQTSKEKEDFSMSEKRFQLESKIKTLREEQSKTIGDLSIKKSTEENREQRYQDMVSGKIDLSTKEDWAEYDALNKSTEERRRKLEEIEQKIKNITEETKEEIKSAKTLLDLEKQRLEEKRKHETGPGAFGRGARDAQKRIVEQAETMEHRLGGELTNQFRNGLVDGMQAAINKADDLSDVMNNIAMNFLGAIQKAYLGKAADAIVGALPFSSGGGVRKYSKGGGVPAMVTNGEYVMGKEAVNRYGGGFMHRLNAGGKLPGYSTGGGPKPGSALAANFGGGEGYATGRRYQSQAMSGFFYSGQAGNVGLQEDTQYTKGIIQERMRKEAEKKAKKRALMQMIVGTALSVGIGSMVSGALSGGPLTEGAEAAGYTSATPKGARMAVNSSGDYVSLLPGTKSSGYSNVLPTRSGMFGGFKNMFSGSSDSNLGQSAADPYLTNFFKNDNNRYFGGNIGKYANGGHIAGKSGIDQIPAMLSEGEYVIRASSARQLGKPMLDRINAGKFNEGGAVTPLIENSETGTSGGNTNNINVTVNMQRGKGKSEEKDSSSSGGTNPKDASAEEERTNHLAEKVKEQVITVIMEEQRPGGLLSD
jgi:hypothetical protein